MNRKIKYPCSHVFIVLSRCNPLQYWLFPCSMRRNWDLFRSYGDKVNFDVVFIKHLRNTKLFHVRFFLVELPPVLLRFAGVRLTWLAVYRVDCLVVGDAAIVWPVGEVIFAIWPVSPWLMTVVTGYIICCTFCPVQGSFGIVLSGKTIWIDIKFFSRFLISPWVCPRWLVDRSRVVGVNWFP